MFRKSTWFKYLLLLNVYIHKHVIFNDHFARRPRPSVPQGRTISPLVFSIRVEFVYCYRACYGTRVLVASHTHTVTWPRPQHTCTNVTELYPSTTARLECPRRDLRHSKNQRVEGAPPIDPRTCTATAGCSRAPACGTPLSARGCRSPRTAWSAATAAGTGSAAARPTWARGSSPARRRSAPAAPPPDTASSRRPPRTSDRPLDATRRLSL